MDLSPAIAKLVRAYGDIKDNSDSGQFLAIQHAAAYCLDHPEITDKIAAKYSRRMDGIGPACCKGRVQGHQTQRLLFPLRQSSQGGDAGQGTGLEFKNAEDVSQWLITEKLISTVPWDDAGAYLRFSVTFVGQGSGR